MGRTMPLSRSNFDRYLAATNVNHTCLHCQQKGWVVNVEADQSLAAELRLAPVGGGGYHAFYSISCHNCGRSDFFHESQVNRWIAANPA